MTGSEFETLFREQFNSLSNLAYTVVRDTDEARDVVQQVFLNYWQRREVIKIQGSAKGYFYRAVLNTALTRVNRAKRFAPISSAQTEKLAEEYAEEDNSQVHGHLHNAISELPPVCQQVFRLSRFSDLTNKEIAEEMSISVKAVEKHITKALKALRERLKPLLLNDYIIILPVLLFVYCWMIRVGYFVTTLSL
jgi:RNA polymerase sigma-70 factor (ECF subfamily)